MTNPQATNLPVVATLEFQGTQLITIKKDGHEFAAMRPIVEGIGLDWKTQHRKIASDNRYGCVTINANLSHGDMTTTDKFNCGHMPTVQKFNCSDIATVGKDGKNRSMLCMPITKLNGWLFSINPNKIPDIKTRGKVVSYQEECFIALYDYWHKGIAERKTPLLPETLIPSEQHELFEAVKTKSAMFRDIGKVRAEIYSRIHNKFKIAKYDQLPRTQLHDALNYVDQMEVKSSKQIEQQAPTESLEVGLLKIRVEALEMKNHFLQQHNDCLKMEADSLRLVMETSRDMAKEVWAMMRELTGGFVLKARIA